MKVKIEPSIAKGEIKAPPSKSYAHRLLICSALANGTSTVGGVIDSNDMKATLDCVSALGVSYNKEKEIVTVKGTELKNEKLNKFYCNESGSTLRFFIPIALMLGGENEFYGTERLLSRGLEIYEDICQKQGIIIEKTDKCVKFIGKLKPGIFDVKGNISSQFITGLLFALPLLSEDSVINVTTELESASYIDITLDTLKAFGIEVLKTKNSFYVKGNQKYIPQNVTVEGDMSNAAFLDAFNILGGEVSVLGLNPLSKQGDSVYASMMVNLKYTAPKIDVSDCPDLAPILFAIASASNGAEFTGTKRLKIKESDRADVMATELKKFGINVSVNENSVIIHKGEFKKPTEILCGHNDHRIVMALSVLASIYGGIIDGCEAVSKSYPNFFEDIEKLGVNCEVIE